MSWRFYADVFFVVAGLTSGVHASIPESAQALSLKEKIGQLFIVPAAEFLDATHVETLKTLIQQEHIGGIILKQGTVTGQRELIARLQAFSSIPLLCVQDAEWGVAMRLRDVPNFPKNLTLGAVQDLSLLYELGQEIGRQCLFVKAGLNLAPVVDVNSNSLNPIIHMRSFGDDPLQVALRATQVSLGMQSVGALSCAKHFPGHGNVSVDPHLAKPGVALTKEEWQESLLPFQILIDSGVDGILSAHLAIDGLTKQPCRMATFSREIITELLRNQCQFDGLIISDALNMKALTQHYSPEQIALGALSAGHDLLLYGDHIAPNIEHILSVEVPRAMRAIEEAVLDHQISEEELSAHVDRILTIKRKLEQPACEEVNGLSFSYEQELKRRLFEGAMTVVGESQRLPLPIAHYALIEWGESPLFVSTLEKSYQLDRFSITDPELEQKLQAYSHVILVCSGLTQFDLSLEQHTRLQQLADCSVPVIAVILCTPYAIPHMPLFATFVVAYENDPDAQRAAAQVLAGTVLPRGRLPISLFPYFQRG